MMARTRVSAQSAAPTRGLRSSREKARLQRPTSNLPEIPKPKQEEDQIRRRIPGQRQRQQCGDLKVLPGSGIRQPKTQQQKSLQRRTGGWSSTTPPSTHAPTRSAVCQHPSLLQSHHRSLHSRRADQDPAPAAARPQFLRCLPVDARPHRRDRVRARAYCGGADGQSRRFGQPSWPASYGLRSATGQPFPGNVVPVSASGAGAVAALSLAEH